MTLRVGVKGPFDDSLREAKKKFKEFNEAKKAQAEAVLWEGYNPYTQRDQGKGTSNVLDSLRQTLQEAEAMKIFKDVVSGTDKKKQDVSNVMAALSEMDKDSVKNLMGDDITKMAILSQLTGGGMDNPLMMFLLMKDKDGKGSTGMKDYLEAWVKFSEVAGKGKPDTVKELGELLKIVRPEEGSNQIKSMVESSRKQVDDLREKYYSEMNVMQQRLSETQLQSTRDMLSTQIEDLKKSVLSPTEMKKQYEEFSNIFGAGSKDLDTLKLELDHKRWMFEQTKADQNQQLLVGLINTGIEKIGDIIGGNLSDAVGDALAEKIRGGKTTSKYIIPPVQPGQKLPNVDQSKEKKPEKKESDYNIDEQQI